MGYQHSCLLDDHKLQIEQGNLSHSKLNVQILNLELKTKYLEDELAKQNKELNDQKQLTEEKLREID